MTKFKNEFFDENYFLYFEEIDLCKKVKNNKGKIFLDPKIIIKHSGASSVDKISNIELEKTEIGIGCGQLFIFIKNIKDF